MSACHGEKMKRATYLFTAFFLFYWSASTYAQDKKNIDKIKQKNITNKVMGSIRRKPESDTVFVNKSEDVFLPFRNKIVRQILIERIGFERTVQDTARTIKSMMARTANALHSTSREWLIRNNLFIKEGKPLNPYRLADNERYLRDLDFILDSRIFVYPTSPGSDSVDILVVTRDVFGFGASIDPSEPDRYRVRAVNTNFLGMGQRLQYTGLLDLPRIPNYGQEILYRKNNLFGSFIDGTAAYTQINTGRSLGNENESAYYFRLNRPLFMPFARWAGGLELSNNFSRNVYARPDSLFASYRYQLQDMWMGYSFGEHHHQTEKLLEDRHRIFISGRVVTQTFRHFPEAAVPDSKLLLYQNRTALLGQITWFRQDFYKTKFIYGFGRTEDVPYGYAVSFTTGWEKQATLERPYFALEGTRTMPSRQGNFITLSSRVATYTYQSNMEDALLSAQASYFSKLYPMGKWGIRHFAEAGYARIVNRTIKNALDVNNDNGIGGFATDSLRGDARLNVRLRASIFTPYKLLGFHFALVPQLDYAVISREANQLVSGRFFQGYSLGIRTRNENLVFNTVEIRGYFYPRTVERIDPVKVAISGNLRIKYPTSLVSAPSTVFGD